MKRIKDSWWFRLMLRHPSRDLSTMFLEQIASCGVDLRLNVWMDKENEEESPTGARDLAKSEKRCSGPELAAALSDVRISDEELRAWQSDLQNARKALNAFAAESEMD